jgi:hypothetical protein
MSDETEEAPLLKPPVFNIPAVFELRTRLMDDVLHFRTGTVLAGGAVDDLVESLHQAMSGHGTVVERLTLHHSVRYLVGRELSRRNLTELAWRLAGNTKRLKGGLPVTPWSSQPEKEWVPIQVSANRYAIKKRPHEKHGRSGRTMRFRILAGTSCPMEITQWWSNEKLDVVAYAIGFKRKAPMHKADQSELMSLRFLGLIEPSLSPREPGFFHVSCPPSLMTYNRDLIKKRRRIKFSCPEGYEHQCHQCPLGVRSCEAATHAADYEEKLCPACGKNWWFDTDTGFVNDNCLHCQPLLSAGIPVKRDPPPAT